jgi:cytochrome c oxidase subunit 2
VSLKRLERGKEISYYSTDHKSEHTLMKTNLTQYALFIFLLLCASCLSTQQFMAIPASLDRSNVHKETFSMTAERFRFTPDEIHVKNGTLVHIDLKSINGTHGFKLGDFGIDESIEEGETKTIEFYAQHKGEFTFRCSHFCGLGHLGMTGKVVVE